MYHGWTSAIILGLPVSAEGNTAKKSESEEREKKEKLKLSSERKYPSSRRSHLLATMLLGGKSDSS